MREWAISCKTHNAATCSLLLAAAHIEQFIRTENFNYYIHICTYINTGIGDRKLCYHKPLLKTLDQRTQLLEVGDERLLHLIFHPSELFFYYLEVDLEALDPIL